MAEQVKGLGVEIISKRVTKIEKDGENFKIIAGDDSYLAKTIILNLGADSRKLNVPGEKEFTGRGVSYCANCDGQFFKNKEVVVVGGGNSAIDAAEVMSKIASKVYVVNNEEKFTGFEALVEKIEGLKNVEVMHQTEIKEIIGEKTVDKIKIHNIKSGEEKELMIDGVFIEIGYEADTGWLEGLVAVDERKQIIVDAKCQTSLSGVFAAGDVTNVPYKQIVIACGQGAIAALSAYEYLQLK
jgi:thioredoxin reductase